MIWIWCIQVGAYMTSLPAMLLLHIQWGCTLPEHNFFHVTGTTALLQYCIGRALLVHRVKSHHLRFLFLFPIRPILHILEWLSWEDSFFKKCAGTNQEAWLPVRRDNQRQQRLCAIVCRQASSCNVLEGCIGWVFWYLLGNQICWSCFVAIASGQKSIWAFSTGGCLI